MTENTEFDAVEFNDPEDETLTDETNVVTVAALAAQAPLWEPGTAHGYHRRDLLVPPEQELAQGEAGRPQGEGRRHDRDRHPGEVGLTTEQ
mgnify:CR=1 FL=1